MIEINFSVCEIIWIYPIYILYWYMDLRRKSKDLTGKKFPTYMGNNFLSNHGAETQIIGEFTNSLRFVYSPLSKERKHMENTVKEIVAKDVLGAKIVAKPINIIKCSQADFETGRETVIQTVKDNAEAFGITDEKAILEQITIKCEQYDREHEVKGGTHQDCVKGKARTILQDRLLPALKEYNACTKSDGLHGKGNCELETVTLNYKAVKTETTDETTNDENENAEPVVTEENEKTK
jgi:hypothetical protein